MSADGTLGFNIFDYCKLQLKNLFFSSFFSSFLMFNFFIYIYFWGGIKRRSMLSV